jgi:uncharacterized membrane protein
MSAKPISVAQNGRFDHLKTLNDLTERNCQTVARIDTAMLAKRSMLDRVVDSISNFTGSLKFIWLHVVWFGFWLGWNLGLPAAARFDPYPFGLLTMIVSLEAILLSTIIMISQNRQARGAELHNNLALQIALLAEQENTKALCMLDAICKHFGIPEHDPDVSVLEQATSPDELIHQIERLDEPMAKHHGEHRE